MGLRPFGTRVLGHAFGLLCLFVGTSTLDCEMPRASAQASPMPSASSSARPERGPRYTERSGKGNADTEVVFDTDQVVGTQSGATNTIRVVLRPRREQSACIGKFDDMTDRELSPLTVKYKYRATLRCLDPCLTDDDLDTMTSCGAWGAISEELRVLRNPTMAESRPASTTNLMKLRMGCDAGTLDRAYASGKLSGAMRDEKTGQCVYRNPKYVKSVTPVDSSENSSPGPIVGLAPRAEDLEFSKITSHIDVTLLSGGLLARSVNFGGSAQGRFHFAGPYYLDAFAGALGESPLAGVSAGKAPSRHVVTWTGTALSMWTGPFRTAFSVGDVGISLPFRGAGWVSLTAMPFAYQRLRSVSAQTFESGVHLRMHLSLGGKAYDDLLRFYAGAYAAMTYGGSFDGVNGEFQGQQGLGYLIQGNASLRLFVLPRFLGRPYVAMGGEVSAQSLRAQNVESTTSYTAWLASLGLGTSFE